MTLACGDDLRGKVGLFSPSTTLATFSSVYEYRDSSERSSRHRLKTV